MRFELYVDFRLGPSNVFSKANEYLVTLQAKFPKGRGLKCLLLDSCVDDIDEDEKEAYNSAMERLWDLLDQAPPLSTVQVQKVQTESRQQQCKYKIQ